MSKVKPLMLPENNQRNRFLSDEEEAKLLQACEPTLPFQANYLKAITGVAMHTGM